MNNWREILRKYIKDREENYTPKVKMGGGTEHDKRFLKRAQEITKRRPIYVPTYS